jgi:benzoate membrane transport protein
MAASGLSFAGVGSAFWALAVGLAMRAVLSPRRPPASS